VPPPPSIAVMPAGCECRSPGQSFGPFSALEQAEAMGKHPDPPERDTTHGARAASSAHGRLRLSSTRLSLSLQVQPVPARDPGAHTRYSDDIGRLRPRWHAPRVLPAPRHRAQGQRTRTNRFMDGACPCTFAIENRALRRDIRQLFAPSGPAIRAFFPPATRLQNGPPLVNARLSLSRLAPIFITTSASVLAARCWPARSSAQRRQSAPSDIIAPSDRMPVPVRSPTCR